LSVFLKNIGWHKPPQQGDYLMTKLQIKMAELKTLSITENPQKVIDLCSAIFGITGNGGGAADGVRDFVGGKMRLAQQQLKGQTND